MGRKTKKFIDKKKAATFQLLSRDSTDPNFDEASGGDRVFVRVDNNPYSFETFQDAEVGGDNEDPDSIFADAPDDYDDGDEERAREGVNQVRGAAARGVASSSQLPEHVRKEILELGFPDDGYNYLLHLREIRNAGGGSAFYQNPKARLDLVPKDVKAYDASKVSVAKAVEDPNDRSLYSVAANSVKMRVQKVFDPEVAALLDDSDLSRFGSDVDDLEEDFVIQANLPEEQEDNIMESNLNSLVMPEVSRRNIDGHDSSIYQEKDVINSFGQEKMHLLSESKDDYDHEKPRTRRLLDEQFDLLERQEYGSEDDVDGDYGGYIDEEDECLAEKLKHAFDGKDIDDLEIDDKYRVPSDLLNENEVKSKKLQDSAADLLRRCMEYAEKYEIEGEENEMVFVEESSDESEVWDCETIVSTYSNFDNHPGKIEAPEVARKKKLSATASVSLGAKSPLIALKGKEKLPVDYLPRSMKPSVQQVKGSSTSRDDQCRRKHHCQESKEEKKERKAAVKEERREARRMKKETKGLYRCEAQRAQRVAAISGPSSIPLT